ncbi:MAG TPA: serine hydrolase [Thermoanaerobaculia bacterium]|nr:serine hydrolase [Thermoanaerobaculia bacterium]
MLSCASFPRPSSSLQTQIETIDQRLRAKYGIAADQTDVGLLDLQTKRAAMIHPDHEEYAASVAKVGILYAWFALGHNADDPQTQHELGLMIKVSSNEMAAKYSRLMGLTTIQQTLNAAGFYNAKRGGGIWVGKHYGPNSERIGDPVANHSHAVTVRQLLRFYWLLSRDELVSPAASRKMREIFLSPDIAHDENKFLKGLSGRGLTIMRKSGTWEDWLHDSAVIEGPGRRYVLVGLTHHPKGDEYLEELAHDVDDLMSSR